MAKRPEKKRQKSKPVQPQLPGMPPPPPPGTTRVLPMQLQIGDRMRRVGSGRATVHHQRRQECPRARPASERAGRDRDEDVGSVGEGQREANECGRVQPMKALPTVASPPLTPNDVNALVRPSDQSRHGF